MLRTSVAALALAGVAFSRPAHMKGVDEPTVRVLNGSYAGLHSPEYDQDFFLGIPFAQPPVGDLRFRVPQSLNSTWGDVKDATAYAKECVGYGSDQWPYEVSEDCLYLNIIRPAGYETADLPVAIWIHGGGYYEGGAVDQRYNLSFIVHNSVNIGKPVIGVSISYRLSAWGFIQSNEVIGTGNTNIGLRDQRLALHWVQENIKAFGGNPSKVTIFGESAGGNSVGYHLIAYGGRDDKLFRSAIMESGAPVLFAPLSGPEYAQPAYDELVRIVNCSESLDTLQCLRELPFDSLNAAINSTSGNYSFADFWEPFMDGDFVQKYTSLQLADGDFVKVPIIIGANTDEGTAFSPIAINSTDEFYSYLIESGLPSSFAEQVLEAYPDDPAVGIPAELPADFRPGPPYGSQYRRVSAYNGDYYFIANRRLASEAWSQYGIPAYSYRFNALPAGLPQLIGVTHFQEVAFVFDNTLGVGYSGTLPFTNASSALIDLARLMSNSWISFVHDLDPNAFSRPAGMDLWPKYSLDEPQNFVFDANVTSFAEPDVWRKEGIALINSHAADVYHR